MAQKSVFLFILFCAAVVVFGADDVSTNMLENLLSDKMFQFTYFLDKNSGASAYAAKVDIEFIKNAAVMIGALLWILQMGKDIYDGALGSGNWKDKVYYSLLKLGIIVAIVKSDAYWFIMKHIIGGIPEMIADRLSQLFMVDFMKAEADYFTAFAEAKNSTNHFLLSVLDNGLSFVIANLGYFVMNAIALATPMVQKCLFELVYYLGPLAFIFMLCDYTKAVFDRWLSMALAISWLSVVCAITMYIYVKSCMVPAIAGANGNDCFSTAITAFIAVAIMLSAPGIAVYLFGAAGSGIDKIASGATMAAGVGKMVQAATPAAAAGSRVAGAIASGANSIVQNSNNSAVKSVAGAIGAGIGGVSAAGRGAVQSQIDGSPKEGSSQMAQAILGGKGGSGGDGNSKLGGQSSVPSSNKSGGATAPAGSGSGGSGDSKKSSADGNSKLSGSSVPSGGKRASESENDSSKDNSKGNSAENNSKLGGESSVPGDNKTNESGSSSTDNNSESPKEKYTNPFTQPKESGADSGNEMKSSIPSENNNNSSGNKE